MRKLIDAHVHIRPQGIAGTHDERFNVTYLPYGQVNLMGVLTIQGMPEYCVDSEFTADTLVHQMDCYGIEKSVIMVAASSNLEVSKEAVKKYPDRLVAAAYVHHDENIDKEIRQRYEDGFRLLKFETSQVLGYTHPSMYPDFKFNSELMKKAYRVCAELKMPITIDPGVPFSKGYQVEEIREAVEENPDVHFIICHLGQPIYPHVEGSKEDLRWREMMDLAKYPNVWFDVCAMPNLFKEEEYPYPTGVRFVHEFAEKYGYNKIVWGTDVPTTYVNCTFRQMINLFERSPLFTDEQKDLLFYQNAIDAYLL